MCSSPNGQSDLAIQIYTRSSSSARRPLKETPAENKSSPATFTVGQGSPPFAAAPLERRRI